MAAVYIILLKAFGSTRPIVKRITIAGSHIKFFISILFYVSKNFGKVKMLSTS